MGGFTGSFRDSLRTLIGLRPRGIQVSQGSCPQASLALPLSQPNMSKSEQPVLPSSQVQDGESSSAKAVESEMSTGQVATQDAHAAGGVASSVRSWLDRAGDGLRKLLGLEIKLAQITEPVVAVAVPEVAGLYHMSVGLAVAAQATWDTTVGTGEDKLAEVAVKMTPQINQFFGGDKAKFDAWFSAFVTSLHLIDPQPAAAK